MNEQVNPVTIDGDAEVISGLPVGYGQNTSLAVSLARAEVDQQIATARAMPRSIHRAVANIMTLATLDEASAEECVYALPRAGKPIKGPSVRLAEIISGQWGNCRVGARVVHVDRIEKYIEAEGVFHDLETNTATTARVRRRISDRHNRLLTEDMIVVTGNAACSIAKRNAILGGVPKAVWRKAYDAVESVIMGDIKTLAERRDKAVSTFAQFGVTAEQVFAALGVTGVEDITMDHLVILTAARSALKNNEATIEELFPKVEAKGDGKSAPKTMADRLDALASGKKDAEETALPVQVASEPAPAVVEEKAHEVAETPAPAEAAPQESDAAVEDDFPGDAPSLIDQARIASMLGRRNFDAWFNALSDEQKAAIKDEMPNFMAAAKQADQEKAPKK